MCRAQFADDVDVTGFTSSGELATGVKTIFLEIADVGAEGARTSVAHGVDPDKIISVTALVGDPTSHQWFAPGWVGAAGYIYSVFVNDTFVSIDLGSAGDGANIVNKAAKIYVTYGE